MSEEFASFSFPKEEHEVLSQWQQHKVFEQSLAQSKDKPIYSFYDGPPFATGLPHHGHLLASTIKDIVGRYYTMTGHYVVRRFGWDCHGLPVEHEIDKSFGKSTAELVEEIGVQGYIKECRDIVMRYTNEWEKTINRMGRWVDFDNDYKTMNIDFMESVWWVFKELWDKDLIYQGTKVVPFSTALGTGLSNFEASSNYQDVQDPSLTIWLKLKDEDAYLTIWTTTPWTLPSNLAVCVNKSIDYVKVKDENTGRLFYIAAERLEQLQQDSNWVVVETLSGADLVGKRYEPLFAYFADMADKGAFQVLADDFVTTSDGTGLVHMAPGFGEDDARVMKEAGLKFIVVPVDDQGCFTSEVTDFAGVYVKDADKLIIRYLKEQDVVCDYKTYVHSYPMCPRSDTPLIYKAIPSWYVSVESLKPALLRNHEQTSWVPSHIKHGRFGKWLEGAHDWAISRNRVWGTPVPLWINDETNNIKCIGSAEELASFTGTTPTDLHRDHIDELVFSIDGEPGVYRRIPEVLDCWFESGSMPYAQQHYPFENQDYFKKAFPADFIAEGLDQTRGWFYTLTVLATALFDKPAFKNVIVNGIITAEDGRKMSKRLKNYTPPDELMERYGADALRLYLINSGLVKGEEQRFTDDGVKDMVRRTLLPWLNAFKFFQTYALVDKWSYDKNQHETNNILDSWIISRLQSVKSLIDRHMKQYSLYMVVPELLLFIDDLTNIYIRLNRSRFWAEGMEPDKCSAFTTLYTVLNEFSVCMAPFAPFLSEHIFQKLLPFSGFKQNSFFSVHLEAYPVQKAELINEELEEAVIRLQQILLLGRQRRNDLKIKVKIPLKSLTIIHKDKLLLNEIEKLEPVIKKELNIKQLIYRTDEHNYIRLYAKPNSPVLGKRYKKRFGLIKKAIESLTSEEIEEFEKTGQWQLDGELLSIDDILIFREPKPGKDVISNRFISVWLDAELDSDLIDEGLAREVINRVQKTRKDCQFNVADRINVKFYADGDLLRAINKHKDMIASETLSLEFDLVDIDSVKANSWDYIDGIDDYALQLKCIKG